MTWSKHLNCIETTNRVYDLLIYRMNNPVVKVSHIEKNNALVLQTFTNIKFPKEDKSLTMSLFIKGR